MKGTIVPFGGRCEQHLSDGVGESVGAMLDKRLGALAKELLVAVAKPREPRAERSEPRAEVAQQPDRVAQHLQKGGGGHYSRDMR
jgi:hypothetical protein